MLYSKLDQETPENRKIAQTLVEKWSRPIYEIQQHYKARLHSNCTSLKLNAPPPLLDAPPPLLYAPRSLLDAPPSF